MAIRLAAALTCAVLAGCGGLPDAPSPQPPSSSAPPPGPPIEELKPKVVAALTKAGQPLGAVTTADKDTNSRTGGYSTSIKYCDTLIGFNFEGGTRPGALIGIRGQFGQAMTVGDASEKKPGLRVEAEIIYEARSLGDIDADYSCPGAYLVQVPLRFRAGVLQIPAVGRQFPVGVDVRGKKPLVVRTTLGGLNNSSSYAFLHGQARLVMRSDPWLINIIVLRARPAAAAEAAKLTDEAQQIAVELAERILTELPP